MIRKLLPVFLLLALANVASTPGARAGSLMTCESYDSPMLEKNVKYCWQRSRPELPQRAGEAVVYFMHGIYGDEHRFEENGYAETVDVLGRTENLKPFTVISFETSALSFFSDTDSFHAGKGSYETWFLTEFMPRIEKTMKLCRKRECRALTGHSMGGFGALKTALRHSELFSVVAANSPALVPYNFREKNSVFYAYFNRHPVGVMKGMSLLKIAQRIFTSWDYANDNDPNFLAQNFQDRRAFPHLYLDMGGKDEYGFQEGFGKFTSILNAKNLPYEAFFEPDGKHDLFRERRWDLIRFVAGNLRN